MSKNKFLEHYLLRMLRQSWAKVLLLDLTVKITRLVRTSFAAEEGTVQTESVTCPTLRNEPIQICLNPQSSPV